MLSSEASCWHTVRAACSAATGTTRRRVGAASGSCVSAARASSAVWARTMPRRRCCARPSRSSKNDRLRLTGPGDITDVAEDVLHRDLMEDHCEGADDAPGGADGAGEE